MADAHLIGSSSRPSVHFQIDSDSDSDAAAITARSSPLPPSPPSGAAASAVPYRDSLDSSPPSPALFDYDDDKHPTAEAGPSSSSYYPPPALESTGRSRETEFELDSDELEPNDLDTGSPLLMDGLIQTSRARQSGEGLRDPGKEMEGVDDKPDWLHKGAGVLAGIANVSAVESWAVDSGARGTRRARRVKARRRAVKPDGSCDRRRPEGGWWVWKVAWSA